MLTSYQNYDGFIAQFLGDGILAYFGFPQAHENDAERAVRAGLDIVSAIPRMQLAISETLTARVGGRHRSRSCRRSRFPWVA